jgi:hypothetical protein
MRGCIAIWLSTLRWRDGAMDKIIEYTSRSRLRRSTAIARRLTDLASVTTSSRTASGGIFTCPSIAAFPIVTTGGQIVTHSLTAYFFTPTTRNWASTSPPKSKSGKYINVVSRHLFLSSVGPCQYRNFAREANGAPLGLKWDGSFVRLSAKSQAHRGKAGLSGWLQVGGAAFAPWCL